MYINVSKCYYMKWLFASKENDMAQMTFALLKQAGES